MKALLLMFVVVLIVAFTTNTRNAANAFTIVEMSVVLCDEKSCVPITPPATVSVVDLARVCELRGYTFWCYRSRESTVDTRSEDKRTK
jgi:hypothetical protein